MYSLLPTVHKCISVGPATCLRQEWQSLRCMLALFIMNTCCLNSERLQQMEKQWTTVLKLMMSLEPFVSKEINKCKLVSLYVMCVIVCVLNEWWLSYWTVLSDVCIPPCCFFFLNCYLSICTNLCMIVFMNRWFTN